MLAEQAEYYPKLAAQTHIPLRRVSACSHVSILNACWRQADFDSATGSLPCRRYYRMLQNAGMAEAYDVTLAPHCPLGPMHWRLACISTLFPITRYFRNKYGHSLQQRRGVTRLCEKQRDFSMVGGFFKPLTKPGLGVESTKLKLLSSVKMPRTGVIRLAS